MAKKNNQSIQEVDTYEKWFDECKEITSREIHRFFETAKAIYKNKKVQIGLRGGHFDKEGCFEEVAFCLKEDLKHKFDKMIEKKLEEARNTHYETMIKRLNLNKIQS